MNSASVHLSVAAPFTLHSEKPGVDGVDDIQQQLNKHLTHYKDKHGESEKAVEAEIANRSKQAKMNNNDNDNEDSDE